MTGEVQKAIRVYVRRFGETPSALYVSRAGRTALWREMVEREVTASPDDPLRDMEPPLRLPLYVEGVPVWAMAGVADGSVDAVHDPRPVQVPE